MSAAAPAAARSHQDRLVIAAGRATIPLDVSIELTHHCNFRCQHCYIPDFHARDGLSTARVLHLLEELAEMGTMFLTLTGGELFLRRDWLTIAQRARELGFALRLFSNGALVDDDVADAIAPLHAVVEISLYAMDPAVFDTVTARPGSFAKTIAGIERLAQRGVRLVLKMPMTHLNADQAPAVVAYARSVGAEWLVTPTIVGKKDGDLSTLGLRVDRETLVEYLTGPFFGGPSQTACHVDEDNDPRRDGPLCAAASRFCAISANGDVLACTILPGSDANINERPFAEIWRHSAWLERVRSIRRSDLHTCSSCPKLSYCGRCHAQALVEDGDLLGPSRVAQERAGLLEELGLLVHAAPSSGS